MNTTSSMYTAICGLCVAFLLPLFAYADGPVIRGGSEVSVDARQILEGDFYAFGETVTISGVARADVYSLGGTVTQNAPVDGDLVIIGGMVDVHGKVGDDVRVVGGKVIIAEPIADDLVIVGGEVRVLSTASVGGDLIVAGGTVEIDGPVTGSVYGAADTLRLDAPVMGGVTVRTGTLTLGDGARIQGDITYESMNELVRSQNAETSGVITKRELTVTEAPVPLWQPIVVNLLMLGFSGLAMFFILRDRAGMITLRTMGGYGRHGLIGFGMLLAIPFIALILMASVIGIPMGIALILGYFALLIVSFMMLPIFMGTLIQGLMKQGKSISFFTVILGVFGVVIVSLVPILGGIVNLVLFLMLFGTFLELFYRKLKRV